MTKPDPLSGISRDEIMQTFYKRLLAGPLLSRLIKIADRLHNLDTSDVLSVEKRHRLLEETIRYYLPIAETLRQSYAVLYDLLLDAIHEVSRKLAA